MSPFPPEDRLAIIAECKAHEATHGHGGGITTCDLGQTSYIIKYGSFKTLATCIEAQSFLYDAEPNSNKPRIPRLIDHFDDDEQRKTYIVIESIKLVKSTPSDLDKRIEGGGYIQHKFFDDEAPLLFVDMKALELYLERGRSRLVNHGKDLRPVSLEGERLICVQADMDANHFGVDDQGNTVMMGFGSISFLPESFTRYTLTRLRSDKFAALPETLGWAGASNMSTMVDIAINLAMTGDTSFGLNKYGTEDYEKP